MSPPDAAARESIADLKARLDLVDVVAPHVALKPGGRHEWWGRCPFHPDKTPSFKTDRRSQRFHCFGCGADGDVLDFLAAIEGLDVVGAIRRLRELAGDTVERRAPPPPPPEESGRNRERAQELWRESGDVRPGSPAWRYLTEGRGLSRWDGDRLRFHPACPWFDEPSGRLLRVPAIVAPVNDHATGLVVGVWRIRFRSDGEAERKGLGPTKGNACRLSRAPGPALAIAEGVEDGLAYSEMGGVPCWAALSAPNMAELVLPERFTEVVVVADRDPNEVGQDAAEALVRRLRAEGCSAWRAVSSRHKDANDVLRARRAAP